MHWLLVELRHGISDENEEVWTLGGYESRPYSAYIVFESIKRFWFTIKRLQKIREQRILVESLCK